MSDTPDIFGVIGREDKSGKGGILYHEALDCDCHLVVYADRSYVEYDFSKYGKEETHQYKIPVEEIDEHLEALQANLQIYKNTKGNTGKTPVVFQGLRNMSICINTKSAGVCIDRYYFPVATDDEYLMYERDLHYCKNKAKEVMENYAKTGEKPKLK